MPVSGESVALLVGYSGSASDQQSEVKQAIYIAALCDPDRCRAALQCSPCSLDPYPCCHITAHQHESPRKVPSYTAW